MAMKTKTILFAACLIGQAAFAVDGLTLSWDDNSDNETGFNVEASRDGGKFELIGQTDANVSTFVHAIPDADRSALFTYRVNAYNKNGVSGFTDTVSARRKDYEAPDSPSNPVITVPSLTINAENVTINQN